MMKKRYRAVLLLTAAVMALSFCSCGSSSEKGGGDTASQAEEQKQLSAAEVMDKLSESGLCPQLDERADFGTDVFSNACEKLYGEPLESFSDGGIMFVSSGASADEVSLLKSGTADCQALLDKRKQARHKDFEGYAPDELDKIDKAEIFETGGLWVMIISDSAPELKALVQGD